MSEGDKTIHAVLTMPVKKYDEFVDFWTWLSIAIGVKQRKLTKFLAVPTLSVLLAIVYYSLGIIKNLTDKQLTWLSFLTLPSLNLAMTISCAVQILVIIIILLIFALRVQLDDAGDWEYGAVGQRRLRVWWFVALFSFLLLYIFLWLDTQVITKLASGGLDSNAKKFQENLDSLLGVFSNLSNNLSTFAFLMCFSAMEDPTKKNEDRNFRWAVVWVVCLVSLTFVEAAVRFGGYSESVKGGTTDWFSVLTGANAGIALAMFCGRLSSPLISPSLSVMVPLYFYALVQITYGFWKEMAVGFVMANLALILKCLLSSVIAWLLTTRHLVFYMERMHRTRSQLEEWRKEFREPAVAQVREPTSA